MNGEVKQKIEETLKLLEVKPKNMDLAKIMLDTIYFMGVNAGLKEAREIIN